MIHGWKRGRFIIDCRDEEMERRMRMMVDGWREGGEMERVGRRLYSRNKDGGRHRGGFMWAVTVSHGRSMVNRVNDGVALSIVK